MQISLHFDPTKDAAADVQSAVLKFYAKINGAAQADALTVDADDETGGTAANPNQLDAEGIPWDARIHTETPTLTVKNIWRKRKGAGSVSEVNAVKAELKARAGTAQPGLTTPALGGLQMPPAQGLQMPPLQQAPGEYEKLVKLLSDNMQTPTNPMGRLNEPWLQATLQQQYNVPGGLLNALQSADPALCAKIRTDVATALGIPA